MENLSDLLASLSESDIAQLKEAAKGLFSSEKTGEGNADIGALSSLDFSALASLLQPQDDARTQLIRSLKPLLSDEKQQRADDAIRLLHLASLLPSLQQSGLLEQLLGGEHGLL